MAGSRRDEQRAFLLRSRGFRGQTFQYDGQEYRVREPSLTERDRVIALGEGLSKGAKKLSELQLECVKFLVDEDGGPLLNDSDRDSLISSVPPEFFDLVLKEVEKMIVPKFAEEAAKNSKGTPSES